MVLDIFAASEPRDYCMKCGEQLSERWEPGSPGSFRYCKPCRCNLGLSPGSILKSNYQKQLQEPLPFAPLQVQDWPEVSFRRTIKFVRYELVSDGSYRTIIGRKNG